ncbi:hypothetical protein BUE80_DR005564 [Diplocarpon rosae]|nr:hypothetical protein BUE80_DR005564 [Diplocarpon rosae]
MTPSSSNSSTAHLPQRVQDLSHSARGVSASGSLLQDRLRERKVESARQRGRSVDLAERTVQSSPTKGREERRPSSSGVGPGKGMGVKQMEEAVSTLHKQNFDLKLELYHRRQRQETMEARLEELERTVAQQAELRDLNDQLLAELQKRDQAVEEAVSMICDLEEKIQRLMQDREDVQAFDATYERESGSPPPDFSSSPPQWAREMASRPKKVSRMPSFLSETTEGNEALRSLYLPHNGCSDATLPQLPEEDGTDSPRLSLLSESSFISVYGDKQVLDLTRDDEVPRRHRASLSIEEWVEERPVTVTVTPPRPTPSVRKSQFLSINDVLESPLQRLEKLKHTLDKTERNLQSARDATTRERRTYRNRGPDHASAERRQTLPPTPDTISTNTLRDFRSSNASLHQGHTDDCPGPTRYAFQSTLSIRPRSAGETVTSRRDGHGWDTPQEDTTDAGSIDSTLSTYSAQDPRGPGSVMPDLFTFSGGDWANGYNREPELPAHAHTASRYECLRRSSIAEYPLRSDDTVVHYSRPNDPQPFDDGPSRPIDITNQPEIADRRSSLSAMTKLRRAKQPASPSHQHDQHDQHGQSPSSASKRSRVPNLRMFGRGESSLTKGSWSPGVPKPTAEYHPAANAHANANAVTHPLESSSHEQDERATPPPIRRSRPGLQPRPLSTLEPRRNVTFAGAGVGADGSLGDSHGGQVVRKGSIGMSAEQHGAENGNGHGNADAGASAGTGTGAGTSKRWFGLGVGRNAGLKRSER